MTNPTEAHNYTPFFFRIAVPPLPPRFETTAMLKGYVYTQSGECWFEVRYLLELLYRGKTIKWQTNKYLPTNVREHLNQVYQEEQNHPHGLGRIHRDPF